MTSLLRDVTFISAVEYEIETIYYLRVNNSIEGKYEGCLLFTWFTIWYNYNGGYSVLYVSDRKYQYCGMVLIGILNEKSIIKWIKNYTKPKPIKVCKK